MFIELWVRVYDSNNLLGSQLQLFNANHISRILPANKGTEIYVNGKSIIVTNDYRDLVDFLMEDK